MLNPAVRRDVRWRFLGLVVAAAVTMIAFLSSTTTAVAYDAYPCSSTIKKRTFNWNGRAYSNVPTQVCPLWRGTVPVHAWSSKAAPIVGYLWNGGSANWFVAQKQSNHYSLGGYYSNWWASTMADNGRWGWVSEVYFSGGGNNERDGRLGFRPGGYVCGGTCPPIPPWWQ